MNELPRSAIELRDALRSGDITATEAAEATLARIAARPELGAFIALTAERALEEARAADTRFAATSPDARAQLPPLHGFPLAHKDLLEVAGAPTSYGTAAMPTTVAENDAPGVAALRAAGAISLGKTQVPELGLNAYSENLVAAPARNPLDLSRTPGGSSGGSAAAVAGGILAAAPGNDGGGSVRIPALACGLVGLKPGLGAIETDLAEGPVDAFGAPRLVVSGPLAHNALDAAMLYDAMRGEQGRGAAATLSGVRDADALTSLRIGLSTASPFEAAHPTPLSPEAREAWRIAADRLAARGHHVEDARFTYDPRYPEIFGHCWMAGLSLLPLPEGADILLTDFTRFFRDRALARTTEEHFAAAATLTQIAADFRTQWGEYDAVLTPGLAAAPPEIGAFMRLAPEDDYRAQCEWTPFTSMVNVAGLPAIAVPTLQLPGGLSMGAQLIGRRGSEPQLLQLAAQLMEK
ncbi:amidase family protein [Leucobacter sp. gxy201]|uniref:amidase n=1 Tax=Leucobacter sp. gxy201 TaxID=2957200 RepID=UPI003D9FFEFA